MEKVSSIDFVQLAIFGFCTGLGTTFGTEIAKYLIGKLRVVNGKNERGGKSEASTG